jgi:hypothetical protein
MSVIEEGNTDGGGRKHKGLKKELRRGKPGGPILNLF